jgi:phosphoribosylaminoimidazole-succinocarboxamide synthase
MNTGSLWDNYQSIQQSVVNNMDPEELYRYRKMTELLIKKTMEEPDDPHVAKLESATQVRLMLRDGLDPEDLEETEREIYVDVYGLKSLEKYKKRCR